MADIHETAYIAPDADVHGNVTVGEDSSVWFHATVRCGHGSIVIGSGSNIQDNCVVHVDRGGAVSIGDRVTVGHGAIIHGCTVGDETLIGMGAILLNDCRIGRHCIIGAGTLITGGTVIPDGSLVTGSPGRIKRAVTEAEIENIRRNAAQYVEEAREYKNLGI